MNFVDLIPSPVLAFGFSPMDAVLILVVLLIFLPLGLLPYVVDAEIVTSICAAI